MEFSNVPIIEKVKVFDCLFNESAKYWDVIFQVKNDPTFYSIQIFLIESVTKFWIAKDIYYKDNADEISWKTVYFQQKLWRDHMFKQALYYIKRYSKERIRLLNYVGIEEKYKNDNFDPNDFHYDYIAEEFKIKITL